MLSDKRDGEGDTVMANIQIEKNIPLPVANWARNWAFLGELEVGDSVLIPADFIAVTCRIVPRKRGRRVIRRQLPKNRGDRRAENYRALQGEDINANPIDVHSQIRPATQWRAYARVDKQWPDRVFVSRKQADGSVRIWRSV